VEKDVEYFNLSVYIASLVIFAVVRELSLISYPVLVVPIPPDVFHATYDPSVSIFTPPIFLYFKPNPFTLLPEPPSGLHLTEKP
jgi:hypothetical protein